MEVGRNNTFVVYGNGLEPDLSPQGEDNSGTNPINFTFDYRLYTELQYLPDGAGSQIRGIMEFRAPLGRDMAIVFFGLFNIMGPYSIFALDNNQSPDLF